MHVRHRLREHPRITCEVLRAVLAFAMRVGDGSFRDHCAMLPGVLAMGIRIFNTDCDGTSDAQRYIRFVWVHLPHSYCAVAYVQLNTMCANTQAHGKPKSVAQPGCALIHVWIRQNGNYGRTLYRAIRKDCFPRRFNTQVSFPCAISTARNSARALLTHS